MDKAARRAAPDNARATASCWRANRRDAAQLVERDQAGAQPVVDVVVVVGDLVGEVRDLRLEPGCVRSRKRCPTLAELRARCAREQCLRMPSRVSKVRFSPRKLGVALLELVDDAQRLQVVLEAAVVAHAVVQRVLAGVAERRVAEVVRQADGLGQRLVEAQRARDRARDLRDLERVREPRAVRSPSWLTKTWVL